MNFSLFHSQLYQAVFSGAYLLFIIGTALTWSSPITSKLTDPNETPFSAVPTSQDVAWISSLLTLGAAIGSFLYGYLANKIGRKYTILSLGTPFLISYLTMSFITTIEAFYAARLLAGLAVGGGFAVVPMYIAELADKSNRGALVSLGSCTASTGILFSYAVGPFITVNEFNLLLSVFPVLFLILYIYFGCETPHYYLKNKNEEKARIILVLLRKTDEVDEEMSEIKRKITEQDQGSIGEVLKSKETRKSFIIGVGLLIFQQFSGINIIYFYSQTIFEISGTSIDPKLCPILLGLVQFGSSFFTPFLIDRFGRKILLLSSAVGMILCLVPLGTYCFLKDQHFNVDAIKFLPILTLTLFIFFYNSGCGPIPWTMLSEIFPSRIKTLSTSAATFVNWTLAFLTTKYFDDMVELVGLGQSFWIYAGCCILGILFIQFYVIETKGKTLEEIQDELSLR